jgi:hypothetical protein
MKYLEELSSGSSFLFHNTVYILTKDFRQKNKNIEFFCISMIDGFIKWIPGNEIVKIVHIYYLDDEKNLVAIKEYEDDFTKNKNLY